MEEKPIKKQHKNGPKFETRDNIWKGEFARIEDYDESKDYTSSSMDMADPDDLDLKPSEGPQIELCNLDLGEGEQLYYREYLHVVQTNRYLVAYREALSTEETEELAPHCACGICESTILSIVVKCIPRIMLAYGCLKMPLRHGFPSHDAISKTRKKIAQNKEEEEEEEEEETNKNKKE